MKSISNIYKILHVKHILIIYPKWAATYEPVISHILTKVVGFVVSFCSSWTTSRWIVKTRLILRKQVGYVKHVYFYCCHSELIFKYKVGKRTHFAKSCRNPYFMVYSINSEGSYVILLFRNNLKRLLIFTKRQVITKIFCGKLHLWLLTQKKANLWLFTQLRLVTLLHDVDSVLRLNDDSFRNQGPFVQSIVS